MIVWCGYLLAIALTALRNDGRVTLFVGGLAVAEYAVLTAVVFHVASPDQLISSDYGTVSLGGQLQRMRSVTW